MTVGGIAARQGAVTLLGQGSALKASAKGGELQVTLPETLPGKYAYVLKLSGYAD